MSEALLLGDEVREALDAGRPLVALETSVLAQGLPHPRNLDAFEAMDGAIRARGAVPAWIFIDRGSLRVGAPEEDLRLLATAGTAAKVARRDIPMSVAGGGPGATTVSATLWAAHRAGIEVAATGGIGGVHPGTGDVSADLLEMARTPCTLVCSGPKSIVDAVETAERLEELGVGLLGYRCDRMPFFLTVGSEVPLEHRADSPTEVAAVVRARRALGVQTTLVVCNPIAADRALPYTLVAAAVHACEELARTHSVTGKAVTPFLLSCLADETKGASVEANLALLESNAALAAEVAAAVLRGPTV